MHPLIISDGVDLKNNNLDTMFVVVAMVNNNKNTPFSFRNRKTDHGDVHTMFSMKLIGCISHIHTDMQKKGRITIDWNLC